MMMLDISDNEGDGNQPDLPPVLDFADLIDSEVQHQEEELEEKLKSCMARQAHHHKSIRCM
eukprot:scaffold640182_cov59-Attheya_sp.AAC.1